MKKFLNQLKTCSSIIKGFDGTEPFHLYLAKYFRANKQFGSRDRRFYKQASYSFWRRGINPENVTEESISNALSLQGFYIDEINELYAEKLLIQPTGTSTKTSVVQGFEKHISKQIPIGNYQAWFETEAPVYLLPFPNRSEAVKQELSKSEVGYTMDGDFMKTQKSPAIQNLIDKGLCRIQDKSSALSVANLSIPEKAHVWDCCCGAGGKSLTLKQFYPGIEQYCSDSRISILTNLKQRYKMAGFPLPETRVCDLSKGSPEMDLTYDAIVADVPCSGSGTWRHNPEQAHFFDASKIDDLAVLQQKIVASAAKHLKPGGLFVYITCSVFEKENEINCQWIQDQLNLELNEQEYFGGPLTDSDYIYRAVFRKI